MAEYRTVLCGNCGRRVADVNTKIKTIQVFDCRHCRKRNVYDPVSQSCTVKDIPIRATSSGVTLW